MPFPADTRQRPIRIAWVYVFEKGVGVTQGIDAETFPQALGEREVFIGGDVEGIPACHRQKARPVLISTRAKASPYGAQLVRKVELNVDPRARWNQVDQRGLDLRWGQTLGKGDLEVGVRQGELQETASVGGVLAASGLDVNLQ